MLFDNGNLCGNQNYKNLEEQQGETMNCQDCKWWYKNAVRGNRFGQCVCPNIVRRDDVEPPDDPNVSAYYTEYEGQGGDFFTNAKFGCAMGARP